MGTGCHCHFRASLKPSHNFLKQSCLWPIHPFHTAVSGLQPDPWVTFLALGGRPVCGSVPLLWTSVSWGMCLCPCCSLRATSSAMAFGVCPLGARLQVLALESIILQARQRTIIWRKQGIEKFSQIFFLMLKFPLPPSPPKKKTTTGSFVISTKSSQPQIPQERDLVLF